MQTCVPRLQRGVTNKPKLRTQAICPRILRGKPCMNPGPQGDSHQTPLPSPPPRAQAQVLQGRTLPRKSPSLGIRLRFFVSRRSRPQPLLRSSGAGRAEGSSSGLLEAGLPAALFERPSEAESGSPEVGTLASCELFWGLISLIRKERELSGWSAKSVGKVSPKHRM